MKKQVIRLHPDDNVAIALINLSKGDRIALDGEEIVLRDQIKVGHKLCLQDIETGQKIIRNQVIIGSATGQIQPGEHVHLHNLKSDYIETLNDHYTERKVNT